MRQSSHVYSSSRPTIPPSCVYAPVVPLQAGVHVGGRSAARPTAPVLTGGFSWQKVPPTVGTGWAYGRESRRACMHKAVPAPTGGRRRAKSGREASHSHGSDCIDRLSVRRPQGDAATGAFRHFACRNKLCSPQTGVHAGCVAGGGGTPSGALRSGNRRPLRRHAQGMLRQPPAHMPQAH